MTRTLAPRWLAALLVLVALGLLLAGTAVGSAGWEPMWAAGDSATRAILWDIRLPRTLGAWLAGALLGLAGAVAQGLFRNPLADPYLLGSATGAALGVGLLLAVAAWTGAALEGWLGWIGPTGAGFVGAVAAVLITVALARGVQNTTRLLLAGVIVGMVAGALASLLMFRVPEVTRSLQAYMLGTTGLMGWDGVLRLALSLAVCLLLSVAGSRALDALLLGETTASSLGLALVPWRLALISVTALATGAAVAHVGLIAFVGLMAPHGVRQLTKPTHRWLIPLSALAGGALLLASDVLSRGLMAPQEMPVGVVTAILGGGYLLWLIQRRPQ